MKNLLTLLFSISLFTLSLFSLSLYHQPTLLQALGQKPVLLAVVGDSISYGSTLSDLSQRYADVAVSRLQQKVVYHNFAIPGATCLNLMDRASTGSLSLPIFLSQPNSAAVVVIECGGIDLAQKVSPETAYANLLQAVGRTKLYRKSPVSVLVATQSDVTASFIAEATRLSFNSMVTAGASSHGYTVLNWGADAVLGCKGCASNATFFAADGLHPTWRGQSIMAANYLAGALSSLNVH